MKTIELSIIIVNYNTPVHTIACLNSLLKAKENQTWEVIIVDNGSSDDSCQQIRFWLDRHDTIPGALIELKQNLGFAAANNIAIKHAYGKYLLLLNSDTEVSADSIYLALQSFKKEKKVGALTVKLLLADGRLDPACHRGFPTPWAAFCYFTKLERLFPSIPLFSGYHQYYKDLTKKHEVDAISGAFLLTSKSIIDDIGLLDETFFMYAEDIDWCYRMKQRGYRIIYDPVATVLHKKKQSGRDNQHKEVKKQTQRYFYQTMKQFYDKHYAKQYPWFINRLVHGLLDWRLFLVNL